MIYSYNPNTNGHLIRYSLEDNLISLEEAKQAFNKTSSAVNTIVSRLNMGSNHYSLIQHKVNEKTLEIFKKYISKVNPYKNVICNLQLPNSPVSNRTRHIKSICLDILHDLNNIVYFNLIGEFRYDYRFDKGVISVKDKKTNSIHIIAIIVVDKDCILNKTVDNDTPNFMVNRLNSFRDCIKIIPTEKFYNKKALNIHSFKKSFMSVLETYSLTLEEYTIDIEIIDPKINSIRSLVKRERLYADIIEKAAEYNNNKSEINKKLILC